MLLLISSTTGRTEDVIFIEKDQKAPYRGLLFSEQSARELRSDILESQKTRLQLEAKTLQAGNLSQIIKLKESEIELYQRQNQRLVESQHTNQYMQYLWFGLGILVTGAAVYGARGLTK